MGVSILKVTSHSHIVQERSTRDRVASSWRSAGRVARSLAVAAWISCVLVAAAWPPVSIAIAVSVAVLAVAALVDVVEHRLPNLLVAGAAVPVAGAVIAAGSTTLLWSALLGLALLGGPLLLTHLVTPAGMGFGDVKAGAVLGAALGLLDAQLALLALVLGLSAAACWGLARRSRSVPFGPGLVAGGLAALLVARLAGIEAVAW